MNPSLPKDSETEALPPGWCFKPSEQQLIGYLCCYDRGCKPLSCGAINEAINPYSFRPDELPNISENGSYYHADCLPKKIAGRESRNRRTLDGSGYWKSTDGKKPIHEEGQIVVYKQNLGFYRGPTSSTNWVMTEYTLHHNASDDAPKAICVIRMTAGNRNQRNEINQPLPGMNQAGALDPPPPLESDNMDWLSYFDFPVDGP